MPTKKKLSDYPPIYWGWFMQGHHKSVAIPCKDIRQANLLRRKLYDFRTVLLQTYPDGYIGELFQNVSITTSQNHIDTNRSFVYLMPLNSTQHIEAQLHAKDNDIDA